MQLNCVQPVTTLYSNHFSGDGAVGDNALSRVWVDDAGGVATQQGEWAACPRALAPVIEACNRVAGLQCVAKVDGRGAVQALWVCRLHGAGGDWLDEQLGQAALATARAAGQRFNLCNPDELPREAVTRAWMRRPVPRVRVLCGAHGHSALQAHLAARAADCEVVCLEPREWLWRAAGFTTRLYSPDLCVAAGVAVLDDLDAVFEDPRHCGLVVAVLRAVQGRAVWGLRAARSVPPFITWVRYMELEGGRDMADVVGRTWRWMRRRRVLPKIPAIQLHDRTAKVDQVALLDGGGRWMPADQHQHLHAMPEACVCVICMERPCNVMLDACRHVFCSTCQWAHVRASRGNLCMLCRAPNTAVHHYHGVRFPPGLDEWMRDAAVPVVFVDTRRALPGALAEFVQRQWGAHTLVTTLHEARDAARRHRESRWVVVDTAPPPWLAEAVDASYLARTNK